MCLYSVSILVTCLAIATVPIKHLYKIRLKSMITWAHWNTTNANRGRNYALCFFKSHVLLELSIGSVRGCGPAYFAQQGLRLLDPTILSSKAWSVTRGNMGIYYSYSISQEICTRFCFALLCCGYTLTDFPISIRLTSLALWQSNDCPSATKATLMNMDKYFMWIHYERLHNHNKAKHNKTVCIFLGIYCIHVIPWHWNDAGTWDLPSKKTAFCISHHQCHGCWMHGGASWPSLPGNICSSKESVDYTHDAYVWPPFPRDDHKCVDAMHYKINDIL